jgi:hypothetical protein
MKTVKQIILDSFPNCDMKEDAQSFVETHYPSAHAIKLQSTGPLNQTGVAIVTKQGKWLGSGSNSDEAWEDAADRILFSH